MPNIDIAGNDLYYERRGTGEPMLLIQGLGGNSLHWGEDFLGRLEDSFELILFDNRGAGRSGPLEGEMTIADLAQDALGLLDALEIDAAHIVGISMGGMVAQEIVLAAPERVLTLTLGCTFPGGPEAKMTDMEVVGMLAEAVLSGDDERTLRIGYEVMIAAEYGEREGAYELYSELAGQYRAPIPVLMAQLSAIVGHDTSDSPRRDHRPHARHPRDRRSADGERERRAHRPPHPGRAPGAARGLGPHVLLGAARAQRAARARPRGLRREVRVAGI